jgi:diguanylate cyclase (GGDEF)-like protein
LLLIDVDRFKALNDHYGHQTGDECLRVVAATVGATIRHSSDLVARYGGEEFAVLLPDTDAAAAERVAERLRAEIEDLCMPHEGSGASGAVVTVSIGVATARPVQPDMLPGPEALVGAADRALYEAKRGGRNCVMQAAPLAQPHLIST